ncbi:MAG: aspartate aminotransferase family protein [Rhodospirillaceae bacterium]|nr:aspartate aminotransferase family protein [Rhodospirillaceae bacterium]MDD9915401.1 aspartate aminotransferase family protein [Rhodospirillaceae bacterium]MDD9929751.1 aspartate aminotransferase family protein [Rhodospirillaceae bacterium]
MSAVMSTYGRYDLEFERGEGPYLFTTDGRRFLDFAAGIAVNSLGHSHPHLVKTLQDQAAKLWHVSNLYNIPDQTRLADRLAEATFADKVFFCSTGLEAMEGAIKLCRRYHFANGAPERWRVVTVEGAFHGRSLATIAAAKNEKHLEGFGPPSDGFDQVPFNNLNELRNAIGPETAAIAFEPIQGEGGIRPADLDYLRSLREIADEFGVLLLFDEVQCGYGRTGKLFAHEWAGITPDVMAIAKGLGSGFPIGAVMATEEAAKGMVPGTHGSTFGGNPLAVSVGNAVLDVLLEDGFLDGVEKKGKILWDRLSEVVSRYPEVYESVRGAGLMVGIKCVVPAGDVVVAFQKEGMLTVPAGENVARLLPPLNIEESHIDEAIEIVDRVGKNWAAGDG